MNVLYPTGEAVLAGDAVRYLEELGIVEMVVTVGMKGSPAWHLQSSPKGGVMLVIPSFGRVFVERTDDLCFVSRRAQISN